MSCWVTKRGLRYAVAAPGIALCLLVGPASWASARDTEALVAGSAGSAIRSHSQCGKPRKSSKAKPSKAKSSKASQAEHVESPASNEQVDSDDLGGTDDLGDADDTPSKSAAPSPSRASSTVSGNVQAADTNKTADAPESEAPDQPDQNAAQADAEAEGQQADEAGAAAPDAEAESEGPSVAFEPSVGFGIATRQARVPTDVGVLDLSPSVVPAAEVGLRVIAWPRSGYSLIVNLTYQSALGFTVTEPPPLSLEKKVRARSERVALDIAPHWRRGQLDFGAAVGATIRTLWPEVHTSQTPGYSLVGPHVRLELNVGLSKLLFLRVSPDAHLIILIDQSLRQVGVSAQGVALGGELGVEARLSTAWTVGVNYRESHALVGTSRPNTSFADVERYLTLRGTGSF